MFNPDDLHPLPRYGLAAGIHHFRLHYEKLPELNRPEDFAALATTAFKDHRTSFLLQGVANPVNDNEVLYSYYREVATLAPGGKSGQNAANGYYPAPHLLTGSHSAPLLKELDAFDRMLVDDPTKNYALKRSFSPLTSKINAGTVSMSDPSEDRLTAAFTALGVLTPYKLAAYDYENNSNVGIIPDLPLGFGDLAASPLLNYLKVVDPLLHNLEGLKKASRGADGKSFRRPPLFDGNFRMAIRQTLKNIEFGSLSLLAAIGSWVDETKNHDSRQIAAVLEMLSGKPIYILGYDTQRQESFRHHLVSLTMNTRLNDLLNNIWKVSLYGLSEAEKYKAPKWRLFKRRLGIWLRFFEPIQFRELLAIRASYPLHFEPIFKAFYTMKHQISTEVLNAAISLAKSINYAAYVSARDKISTDNATNRDINEYKARALTSLESNIRSATSATQFLSQISTLVGRITNRGISGEAELFMRAMLEAGENHIELDTGKELVIAFMRIEDYAKSAKTNPDEETDEELGF